MTLPAPRGKRYRAFRVPVGAASEQPAGTQFCIARINRRSEADPSRNPRVVRTRLFNFVTAKHADRVRKKSTLHWR